jgi:hypothetical protein
MTKLQHTWKQLEKREKTLEIAACMGYNMIGRAAKKSEGGFPAPSVRSFILSGGRLLAEIN